MKNTRKKIRNKAKTRTRKMNGGDLKTEIQNLNTDITTLEGKINEIEGKINEIKNEKDKDNNDYKTNLEKLENLKKKKNEIIEENKQNAVKGDIVKITKLNDVLQNLNTDITTLEGKINKIEDKINEIKNEKDEDNNDYKKNLEKLKKKKNTLIVKNRKKLVSDNIIESNQNDTLINQTKLNLIIYIQKLYPKSSEKYETKDFVDLVNLATGKNVTKEKLKEKLKEIITENKKNITDEEITQIIKYYNDNKVNSTIKKIKKILADFLALKEKEKNPKITHNELVNKYKSLLKLDYDELKHQAKNYFDDIYLERIILAIFNTIGDPKLFDIDAQTEDVIKEKLSQIRSIYTTNSKNFIDSIKSAINVKENEAKNKEVQDTIDTIKKIIITEILLREQSTINLENKNESLSKLNYDQLKNLFIKYFEYDNLNEIILHHSTEKHTIHILPDEIEEITQEDLNSAIDAKEKRTTYESIKNALTTDKGFISGIASISKGIVSGIGTLFHDPNALPKPKHVPKTEIYMGTETTDYKHPLDGTNIGDTYVYKKTNSPIIDSIKGVDNFMSRMQEDVLNSSEKETVQIKKPEQLFKNKDIEKRLAVFYPLNDRSIKAVIKKGGKKYKCKTMKMKK